MDIWCRGFGGLEAELVGDNGVSVVVDLLVIEDLEHIAERRPLEGASELDVRLGNFVT